MKKKNNFIIFVMVLFLYSFIAEAIDANDAKNHKFVFAIFATNRTRATLVEKALEQNIFAYNLNWKSEIDLERRVIRKVWTRQNNGWVRITEAPLPDVVFDFGVYKNAKQQQEIATSMKNQLHALEIPFINPEKEEMEAINNKVLFAKVMRENSINHPSTVSFGLVGLLRMIHNHSVLFFKPTFGSKGQGIIIVGKQDDGNYSIQYKIRRKKEWKTVVVHDVNLSSLYSQIKKAKKEMGREKTRYLIQEGVLAYRFLDKQTDFRVNVQRGKHGVISVSGVFMRVGGNLSQGGRPADYSIVLKPLEEKSGIPIRDIMDSVTNISVDTLLALENNIGKKLGDIGVDIVVDNQGKPHVIEANGKNGFSSMYLRKNPLIDRLYGLPSSLEVCEQLDGCHEDILLDYAAYLAFLEKDQA